MRRRLAFDSILMGLYCLLVFVGWMTIYSVSTANGYEGSFWAQIHGKQVIWIGVSLVFAFLIVNLDLRFIQLMIYPAYFFFIAMLILVLFIGKEVYGARSWIILAGQPIQPSEFAKVATALALARYLSGRNISMGILSHVLTAAAIVLVPAVIVVLQNDTGSALVFFSFLIVFFREGLHPLIPIAGITLGIVVLFTLGLGSPLYVTAGLAGLGLISFYFFSNNRNWVRVLLLHVLVVSMLSGLAFSTDLLVSKLQPHQQNRIMVLFNPELDPQGAGYNVIQSKIAIGSGGLSGKGYHKGSYTKSQFVPKQETDFIYCTVGEEFGWLGSGFFLFVFFMLLVRISFLAENAKTRFARVYGYGVLSILFFHVLVNIGMTVGLMPVIGIPLPFFSYGGSSLLAFTVLIFFLQNFYAHRTTILGDSA